MKRIIIAAIFALMLASCESPLLPCPKILPKAGTERTAIVTEVSRTTVTIELDGHLWAFYGDGFEVGEVITVVMKNGCIIQAYK